MQKFAETNDTRALHEQYPIGVSVPSHSLLGFGPELLLPHTGIAIVIHVFLEDLGYACNRLYVGFVISLVIHCRSRNALY
jgi:hypothetical protein